RHRATTRRRITASPNPPYGPSILRIDLDQIALGVPEEQRAVTPVGQIGRAAQDRHALGEQLGMAGIDGGRRNAEGELHGGGAGEGLAISEVRPAARAQRQERRADAEAAPVGLVGLNRELHDVAVEGAGFVHLRAKQDGVVEVGYSTEGQCERPYVWGCGGRIRALYS